MQQDMSTNKIITQNQTFEITFDNDGHDGADNDDVDGEEWKNGK